MGNKDMHLQTFMVSETYEEAEKIINHAVHGNTMLVMTQAQLTMTKSDGKGNCRYNFVLKQQHLNSENTVKTLTHTIFMLHVRSPKVRSCSRNK
jgi:hypothetical protein